MKFMVFAVLILTSSEPKFTQNQEGIVSAFCKGILSDVRLEIVLEGIKRGMMPEITLQDCLDLGIIPPWTKEEEGEG
jgi:hypothetical protein